MEYYINKVRKNEHDNIIAVNLLENIYHSKENIKNIDEIIRLIQAGNRIYTVYQNESKMIRGELVLIERNKGNAYLITRANNTSKDNLDNLPLI